MAAPEAAGSAEDDYAAIRPAALAAATAGCPLVVAWLSRGDGADLELITMAPRGGPGAARQARGPRPGGPRPGAPTGGPRPRPVASAAGSPATAETAGGPLLFPPGARAEAARDRAAELERLVWAPCLAGPAPRRSHLRTRPSRPRGPGCSRPR